MMKLKIILFSLIIIIWGVKLYSRAYAGDVLPPWTEGYLDIHHINTGLGESAFFIMPDGTTMLVDAGVTPRPKPRVTDPRPDGSRTPGEWISRYITRMLEGRQEIKLDYILATHFHSDHIGGLLDDSERSDTGPYILTGITEVGERLAFDKLIDRGWPGYDYPTELTAGYIENYIQFVNWSVENRGVEAEQIRVGANDQITLVNNPASFPEFEIRNIAANGYIWTGHSDNIRNHFPPGQLPNENMASIAFRLSYGKFNYFNGGDICRTDLLGSRTLDVETPIGLVTGPVDVCLANHHGHFDAMNVSFLEAVRPRVVVIFAFNPLHPSPSTLRRMMSTSIYPGERDIFATNIMEEQRVVIGDPIESLKSQQGHIVVRVAPGGDTYMIYILDDSEENFRIQSVHGPYDSR